METVDALKANAISGEIFMKMSSKCFAPFWVVGSNTAPAQFRILCSLPSDIARKLVPTIMSKITNYLEENSHIGFALQNKLSAWVSGL